ncbi:MAG: malonyl-CoA decarboxylase family protein [Acidobacteriota bacterium]
MLAVAFSSGATTTVTAKDSTQPSVVGPDEVGSREFRTFLSRLFHSITKPGRAATSPARAADLVARCRALLSERGEVSGARLASEVIEAYTSLPPEDRESFFDFLADKLSVDPDRVDQAAAAYRDDRSWSHLSRLQAAVEASRQELFRRINMGAGGTAMLLRMRREWLATLTDHPERSALDADLLHLLKSWFNRGFLVLQRIDWRTSALVLERLIRYEAVHQIQGWRDLQRRLEADRRCYAFFHPTLPDEPLIFIEVALTRGLSAQIQPLLNPDSPVLDPLRADTAVFYSITNCQEGLRGVSFGNFLIKQVVEDLGKELTRVRSFATLSPIPGFRQWLQTEANIDPVAQSRDEVVRWCARYLLHAKQGRVPADPVARFHLANGAKLERLNWMGDTSAVGTERSFGLTANYVYQLRNVERNHEAYARDFTVVASPTLERLALHSGARRGRSSAGKQR